MDEEFKKAMDNYNTELHNLITALDKIIDYQETALVTLNSRIKRLEMMMQEGCDVPIDVTRDN